MLSSFFFRGGVVLITQENLKFPHVNIWNSSSLNQEYFLQRLQTYNSLFLNLDLLKGPIETKSDRDEVNGLN